MFKTLSWVKLTSVLPLLCLALSATSAEAQVIARDSYLIGTTPASGQYTAATALRLQPAGLVNTGFANGPYSGGTGTSQFSATTSGLSYSPLGATSAGSGKVSYAAAPLDNTLRSNARNLSPAVSSQSTYWMSVLVNRGAITSTGLNYAMTGFGNAVAPTTVGAATTTTGLYVGFSGDSGNLAMRYRNTSGVLAESVLLATSANTTYAIVARIAVNTSGITDNVTWWVNPTDFTSTTTLTSTALATNSFSGNLLSAGTDFVRLNYLSYNWNSSAFFDEVTLGTTLASLGGASFTAAPEPGTLVLGLMGIGAMWMRRRRNSD